MTLAAEQKDDDAQLKFCEAEFSKSAQEAKDTSAALTRLAGQVEYAGDRAALDVQAGSLLALAA
ncbi:MAG: hypothetical protein ABGY75_20635 [Gemmataceae bacterium]